MYGRHVASCLACACLFLVASRPVLTAEHVARHDRRPAQSAIAEHSLAGSNQRSPLPPASPAARTIKRAAVGGRSDSTESPILPLDLPEGYWDVTEAAPFNLQNGEILIAWVSSGIFYSRGSFVLGQWWWEYPVLIDGEYSYALSGITMRDGRHLIVWCRTDGMYCSVADSSGTNWSPARQALAAEGIGSTTLSITGDGRIWLTYGTYRPSADLFCVVSSDNGETWGLPQTLANTSAREDYGSIATALDSTGLLLFYQDNSSGTYDIYRKLSVDGGSTWSAPVPVVYGSVQEQRPRVLRDSSGVLWLAYQALLPSGIAGFSQSDVFTVKSADDSTWTSPERFTRYAGYDGSHSLMFLDGRLFVSFASGRFAIQLIAAGYSTRTIWYGIVGESEDLITPPALLQAQFTPPVADSPMVATLFVDDDDAISRVSGSASSLFAGDGPESEFFDDGMHDDGIAGDGIYTGSIGSFGIFDFVWVLAAMEDSGGAAAATWAGYYDVPAVHDAGDLRLSLHYFATMADQGVRPGASAHWPSTDGQDYLYMGGLCVCGTAGGVPLLDQSIYWETNFRCNPDEPRSIGPGISDRDCDVSFTDGDQPSSPGVSVRQQSYQWSTEEWDDFIIVRYTLRNRSLWGALEDVYATLWTDPDISMQSASNDDLGGFDSTRHLAYMYDSQANPPGYFGIKLLRADADSHTVHFYDIEHDLQTTSDVLDAMTRGGGSAAVPNDYRMMLTAGPFDLGVDESREVVFGVVMGNGLDELRANADTMQAVYDRLLPTATDRPATLQVPTRFELQQNYPNPFNPSTTIRYGLPGRSHVTLAVYNMLGQQVATLAEGEQEAGNHQVVFNAGDLASGVYLARLRAGGAVLTRAMLFLR